MNSSSPNLILSADLHITEKVSVCRTDDFLAAQHTKLRWLRKLASTHGCPVVVAGDVFDSATCSHGLVRYAMQMLPEHTICIPGQHDLPNHRADMFLESPLGVVTQANKANTLLYKTERLLGASRGLLGVPFGMVPPTKHKKADILILHTLTWHKQRPFETKQPDATHLLKKLRGYRLIVTGDNHDPFVASVGQGSNRRILVNPGSMMRTRADQIDHKPRVYLWYEKDNRVEPVFFPIEEGVVSREHIEREERDKAVMKSFVRGLNKHIEIGLKYTDNLKRHMEKNNVHKRVRTEVWEAVHGS